MEKKLYIWELKNTNKHNTKMKKSVLILFMGVFFLGAHSQENFWLKTTHEKVAHLEKTDRGSEVTRSEVFHLNFSQLKATLATAPNRDLGITSELILTFPSANGELHNYSVYEAPVMHKELSDKYQDIKSYVGIGVKDKTNMIRFSTTLFGFHGMISSGNSQTIYIDPYTKDLNNYIVYFRNNAVSDNSFECHTESIGPEMAPDMHYQPYGTGEIQLEGSLRKFRLAMACTIEYAAFHVNMAGLNSGTIAQKKAAVLNAMNVTMTRVNGVYERDLSVTMELVPDNENIIFITSDNFNNNNAGTLINQSQTVIDNIIGFNNYDIGHTVSTGGGGLAQLYSPCSNSKARGVTGLNSPVGDPFDIDYVAHEMGHQFGANHIFNNSCSGNRNNSTAIEPGSGSTIMGYAGICPPNVQSNSDAYFNAISLAEIRTFILGWGNCSENTSNGNTKPTITPIPNYTIPKGTAFVLRGNGADADGDALTYTWEQTNQQTSVQPPTQNNLSGPNFRSLAPSASPDRYMPDFMSVLQGNLTPTWEVVPNVGRTMTFALTVRDNNLNGGEYARANMTVTTSNVVGPFVVTSQDTTVNWEASSTQTVTWDVAGTTSAPVNTQFVNILLSTNGGESFDYVLASNTPNDGSEIIQVPNNIATSNARIMIEAIGNIFYAVNTSPFTIGDCVVFANTTTQAIPDSFGSNVPGAPLISTIFVEDDITIQDLKVSLNINHSWNGDLNIRLEHPNGSQIVLWNRTCNNGASGINVLFDQTASSIVCSSPTSGAFKPIGNLNNLNGLSAQGEWKLIITDNWNGDTGTLNSWSLDLGCTATATVNNFELNNFKLYPNPNNGNFTIAFSSDSTQDINIAVFDIRGRKVVENTCQNTGEINQNINLQPVQPGVYMMVIKDGNITQTRKIIIQ